MNMKYILAALAVCLGAAAAMAIPAKLGVRTYTQPDGSVINICKVGDEHLNFTTSEEGYLLAMDADGFYKIGEIDADGMIVATDFLPTPEAKAARGKRLSDLNTEEIRGRRIDSRRIAQSGMGMYKDTYPTTGSPRCLIFLVEYQDVRFSMEYDPYEYFSRMMNDDDFDLAGGTGGVARYFREQSGGKFTPIFDIYGPVTLPNYQEYYGGNYEQGWDVFAHYMVRHAAEILDPKVDFSVYDEDGDGDIDFIYVFYAGQGEHNLGDENTVWPHSGYLKQVADFKIVDGKWLNLYACSNELEGDVPAGMGNFVHEYCHVIGLPDLYTTDMSVVDRDFTPGQYSILDYGVYNNDARTPPNFTAYERNALGWDEPFEIKGATYVELPDISTGDFGIIQTNKDSEFFLLENRQLKGWDAGLPGHGLLVWHIDYTASAFKNNQVNTNRNHQRVRLLKANGEESFIRYADGFPFPGTANITELTPETSPALRSWSGQPVNVPLTNIREQNGYIGFCVAGYEPDEDIELSVKELGAEDVEPVYFNLQGQRINIPERGMPVIERRGASTRKIIYQ